MQGIRQLTVYWLIPMIRGFYRQLAIHRTLSLGSCFAVSCNKVKVPIPYGFFIFDMMVPYWFHQEMKYCRSGWGDLGEAGKMVFRVRAVIAPTAF